MTATSPPLFGLVAFLLSRFAYMIERFAKLVFCLAPFCGLGVSLWILRFYSAASSTGYIQFGCGFVTGFDCSELLRSGHAYLLGFPVALWGVVAYTLLCALTALSAVSSIGAAGSRLGLVAACAASCWFIWVMLSRSTFCLWCATIHAVNLSMAIAWLYLACSNQRAEWNIPSRRWLTFCGRIAVFSLVLGGLWLFHDSDTHWTGRNIDKFNSERELLNNIGPIELPPSNDSATAMVSSSPNTSTQQLHSNDVAEIEVYIDFTCEQCARLYRMLREVQTTYPNSIRIRTRIFPLENSCNVAITKQDSKHFGACSLARLGHAIQSKSPQSFARFHDQLIRIASPISLKSAREIAESVTELQFPDSTLNDALVDRRLAEDIDRGIDLGILQLPAMLIKGMVYEGCPDRMKTLLEIVRPGNE